ncbi:MAG: hypothetical protein ACREGE_01020 [Candidatus Microsaccharimonas sp.]
MTEEAASEDSHLLNEIETAYSPAVVGQALQEHLAEIAERLHGNILAILRLTPYLTNVIYTDRQRWYAEREVFRLEKQRKLLLEEYSNARIDASDFHESAVAVPTHHI